MTHAEALSLAIVVALVGAWLLTVIPQECKCKQCPTHVREREEREKAREVQRHDDWHRLFPMAPRGSGDCPYCKRGVS